MLQRAIQFDPQSMAFYIGGLDTMTKIWASSYFSLTEGLSVIGTLGACWGINLRITCKKPDPNWTFYMDLEPFSKFDEK